MGVVGAAVASALSYVWDGIHITWRLCFAKGHEPEAGYDHPAAMREDQRDEYAPAVWSLLGVCGLNSIGETATAAHTIANTVESAFYIPAYGVSIIVEGLMMGVGKTKAPFLYNITGMWCVRIVGAMICIRFLGMGLVSAWACMIAHNMLLFCLYLGTFIRGGWNPFRA